MVYQTLNKQIIILWAGMHANNQIMWCFTNDFYKNKKNMNSAIYACIFREFLLQIYKFGQF